MTLSLNEVEAVAKRATRGAGYSWGQAEDAAKATRWLCAQGLDGVGALCRLADLALADQSWQVQDAKAERRVTCPLAAGTRLSDHAHRLPDAPLTLAEVALPVFLLPFAANAARALQTPVTVEIDGVQAVTDGHGLALPVAIPDQARQVLIRVGGALTEPRPEQPRAAPAPEDWAALNRIAHKTYAPATEDSRQRGAGAGLSDND